MAPVRSDRDLKRAQARLDAIMDGPAGSDRDELEVLQAVIERYSRDRFALAPPTPLQAITTRMEQKGWKPRDLIPLLGSRSRVSEVLNGARPLSIDMIRALHAHLGIPADVLIAQNDPTPARELAPSPAAMAKLGSFGLMRVGETVSAFVARAFGSSRDEVLLRKTRTDRVNTKTDADALQAWSAAAVLKSMGSRRHRPADVVAKRGSPSARRLAELSSTSGPAGVAAHLAAEGVAFVVLDHLPGTFLDGAALLRPDGKPLIALTLRYDRIDNFWFTLLHEYAHVCKHLGARRPVILDDLQLDRTSDIEDEADDFAQKALIPAMSASFLTDVDMTPERVAEIARLAKVHPAIIAGRWQREHGDYRRFSRLLGHGEVKPVLR